MYTLASTSYFSVPFHFPLLSSKLFFEVFQLPQSFSNENNEKRERYKSEREILASSTVHGCYIAAVYK